MNRKESLLIQAAVVAAILLTLVIFVVAVRGMFA